MFADNHTVTSVVINEIRNIFLRLYQEAHRLLLLLNLPVGYRCCERTGSSLHPRGSHFVLMFIPIPTITLVTMPSSKSDTASVNIPQIFIVNINIVYPFNLRFDIS